MGFSLICICPGSYVNRLTCRPGQNPLSRSAISACFREPGHSGFLNSYRLADGIGGIRPILELARCPGFRINRLTFIPGQQKLSRFAGYRPKCVSVLACVPLWQWAFLLFELYGRGTRGRPECVSGMAGQALRHNG
ncbi:hypothetical protein HMPREF3231_00888 [Bifidobacterium longum]|nr:hypothetical protein HMPREF3231_00888 [Bifidobacterium longum]